MIPRTNHIISNQIKSNDNFPYLNRGKKNHFTTNINDALQDNNGVDVIISNDDVIKNQLSLYFAKLIIVAKFDQIRIVNRNGPTKYIHCYVMTCGIYWRYSKRFRGQKRGRTIFCGPFY